MDKDKYDEQAERLLPCICQSVRGPHHNQDNTYCPAYRRPAVADALRGLGLEIEQLRDKCNTKDDEYMQQVRFAEGVIANLRAERDQLKAQLAEAEKRGFINGLVWCKGLMNNDGQCTTGAHDVIDLQVAKSRAELEKTKP